MSDDESIQARITILQNAGMAEAAGERLDLVALAVDLGMREQTVGCSWTSSKLLGCC